MQELGIGVDTGGTGGECGGEAVRLVEGVEGKGGAGFALTVGAVAGVDDQGGRGQGVANESAGTAAMERVRIYGAKCGRAVWCWC